MNAKCSNIKSNKKIGKQTKKNISKSFHLHACSQKVFRPMRCCIYKTTRKAQNRSTKQRENDIGRDGDTKRHES